MKIFLGSSKEAKGTMIRIGRWLKEAGHTPVQWDSRGAFRAGHEVLAELVRHSTQVDGAIFIFAPDDHTWVRGKRYQTTRDNVLLEYGLFLGSLGRDSGLCVRVGRARIPTDMSGLQLVCLPGSRAKKSVQQAYGDARSDVIKWARRLRPVFLKRLGFDLAEFVSRQKRTQVSSILRTKAPELIRKNTTAQIRAVCSDKGPFGKEYYESQFKWVKNAKRKRRSLRRVFIRSREERDRSGFLKGEAAGILMHAEAKADCPRIQFRWIYEDDDRLSGTFLSNLGFAVFGKSWLVHWGLETGFFHEQGRRHSDRGVGDRLIERFEDLWENASDFNEKGLLARLRYRRTKVGRNRK